MPMTTVRAETRVRASPARVFDVVSDYRKAVRIIDDLEDLRPVGPEVSDVGATFDAVVRVGPKKVAAQIRITELVRAERVTWASSGADDRQLTFELERVEEMTAVVLTVRYRGPEGVGGMLLAPVVEEMVHKKAKETLRRLAEL